ncbi:DivIVA domain-containing protein [Streptomyces sp. GC420]|uniref:DivIVA domain-containing protein n=1 Tax=Streptomyces sp. GC420 TaxID=2697568 RepID=UPI001414E8C2|nr:DivIVA domain-containing protein [Streptomyces sp. GC420]NBM17220.1 DivIVA domain-containing protein [Streptomyces sp. GC420]
MFLFLLIALVVVVAAVTLAVVGGGEGGPLAETSPDRVVDPLPAARAVSREDVESLRLPVAVRGYRMAEVDDVLNRLGAELAERDDRIARLEAELAGAGRAGTAPATRPDLLKPYGPAEPRDEEPGR